MVEARTGSAPTNLVMMVHVQVEFTGLGVMVKKSYCQTRPKRPASPMLALVYSSVRRKADALIVNSTEHPSHIVRVIPSAAPYYDNATHTSPGSQHIILGSLPTSMFKIRLVLNLFCAKTHNSGWFNAPELWLWVLRIYK
jgi:hypothetical protein